MILIYTHTHTKKRNEEKIPRLIVLSAINLFNTDTALSILLMHIISSDFLLCNLVKMQNFYFYIANTNQY